METRGSAGLRSSGFLKGGPAERGVTEMSCCEKAGNGKSSVVTGTVLLDQMAFVCPQFFPVLTQEGDDTFLLVTVGQSLRGYRPPAWVQRTFPPPGLTRLRKRTRDPDLSPHADHGARFPFAPEGIPSSFQR